MTITSNRSALLLSLAAISAISACSFWESSESSSKSTSKSISSSFESSSKSSNSEDEYRADVRDFTAAYLKSNGRPTDLRRKIAEIAEKHGVSDWQDNESTYRGIGEGLGKAGARQVEVDAFKSSLTENDRQAEWMQEGYDSEK